MSAEPYSQIIEALRLVGVTTWRSQSGRVKGGRMHLAPKGTPDLVGFTCQGQFVGIEVKTPTGKMSAEQEQWHESAKRRGCIALVARTPEEAVNLFLEEWDSLGLRTPARR